jgi:tetraacyldisaccharide 4'-kinase
VSLTTFFEAQFFKPKWYHLPFIVLLLPLSVLYGTLMLIRRLTAKKKTFSIPIISVGNLIVGGSGKTPFVIAIANRLEGCYVISRGYGRESQGLIEVSHQGELCTTVHQSGDEAMLMARSLPHASVIVSEDRVVAIEYAIAKGAQVIVLDDGFNRVNLNKFDIILEPATIHNYLPFPAGGFREFWFTRTFADLVLKEGKEFQRIVTLPTSLPQRVLFVTAISNPQRLGIYLPPNVVYKHYQEDHSYFSEEKLQQLLEKHNAQTLLCTAKDRVKMQGFHLPIQEMSLTLELNSAIISAIKNYIQGFKT